MIEKISNQIFYEMKSIFDVIPSCDTLVPVELIQRKLGEFFFGLLVSETLCVFGTKVIADGGYRQSEWDVSMHCVSQSVGNRPHLGIESTVAWSKQIASLVQTNVHSSVLEGLDAIREWKGRSRNKRDQVLIVGDSQMTNFL